MPPGVLIVDDNAGFRASARALLEAAGYDAVDHSAGRWAGVAIAVRRGRPLDGVVRGLAVPAATPAPVRARLEAALLATMDDPAWQADAARLYQPLRRMDGATFTALVRQEEAALRRLWQERPWKD
jgi:CheY-like chemotaxis protein